MERKKVSGIIVSKEYSELSNNYKLEIITADKQRLFFYSQQRHQQTILEIEVNGNYAFCLFKGKKYWFLDNWEKTGGIIEETPE